MASTTSTTMIKTRFLVLSDTHGTVFQPDSKPFHHADVAIHCGDLTEESKLDEFQGSLRLLEDINAPLKLVIAGNHDFTLDIPISKKKVADARLLLDPELVKKVYGYYGEARRIFEDARDAGIIFLDEGVHHFTLNNGAALTVYASAWTPSLGDWGFQYQPAQGHSFEIPQGVDMVMTHGPPKGIMDYTDSKQRAGCPDLFAAIFRARPRLHCFGHIHEGCGAKMVTWRDSLSDVPSHFTNIDNERSVIVERLSGLRPSEFDTEDDRERKAKKQEGCRSERCCATSHCTGDANPLEVGKQTLFVNAAVQGTEEDPMQLPWLVDLELPRAPKNRLKGT